MKKGKRNTLLTVIGMLAISGLLIFGFYSVQHKTQEAKLNEKQLELDSLIGKDLENSYPSSPKEVLKLYNRIMKCYYNFNLTNEELDAVAKQAYALFDDELKQLNPYDNFFLELQADVKDYHENNRTIPNNVVGKASSTDYNVTDGKEYASLLSSYLISEKGNTNQTVQKYHFRKDDNGNWKLLYWELTDEKLDSE